MVTTTIDQAVVDTMHRRSHNSIMFFANGIIHHFDNSEGGYEWWHKHVTLLDFVEVDDPLLSCIQDDIDQHLDCPFSYNLIDNKIIPQYDHRTLYNMYIIGCAQYIGRNQDSQLQIDITSQGLTSPHTFKHIKQLCKLFHPQYGITNE